MKYLPALLLSLAVLCAGSSAGQYVTGQGARMIIGQATFTDQLPLTTDRNLGAAGGVAYANDTLFVADSSRFFDTTPQNRRILIYRNISSKFPAPTDRIPLGSRCAICTGRNDFPSTADVVVGQPDFTTSDVAISQTGMRLPTAVASDGKSLIVADTENNRILIWNNIPASNTAPADIVLGQESFDKIQQPVVVSASSFRGPQGVWIQDGRLYVADTQNHRVLIWRSMPTKNNQQADIVLGQPNFTTAPEPDLTRLSTAAKANNLLNPVAVTSDGKHLFVTDLGFQRVLIWNSIPDSNTQPADVVVGEPDTDTTIEGGNDVKKMCSPTGAQDANGNDIYPTMCASTLSFPRFALSDGTRLYIADGGNDRVLIFNSIPVSNGASADVVLGQRDFNSDQITDAEDLFNPNLQRSSADTIRTPTALAWDGMNLYVADPYDRRVLVFTPEAGNIPVDGVRNAASLRVYAVGSVAFTTGPAENDEVKLTISYNGVDNTYSYKAVKDDGIEQVILGLVSAINAGNGNPAVLATANVPFNSITLTARFAGSEGDNITLSYTLSDSAKLTLTTTNPSGGGDAAKIAPGTLVTIQGQNLADTTVSAPSTSTDLPRELGNVEVYFDGIRAPLLMVSPNEINAQVPYEVSDTTSITSWVRTQHSDGTVTVSTAVAVPITQQNPGIFAQPGEDPRPAIAYHSTSYPMLSLLVDGVIKGGDTGTIVIDERSYTYTVQQDDSLANVRDAFITLINNNTEEKVTAEAGGSFARVILKAKDPGNGGMNVKVSASTSTDASLTLSPSSDHLCCGNIEGATVTEENPAIAGEMIYVWATGLGLVKPDEAKVAQATGAPYSGPAQNDPNSFVSSLAGGRTANVISASAVPGTIGLYKVVLELNSDLPTNPQTQLTIAQDVYVSNIVTVPVVNPNPPSQ